MTTTVGVALLRTLRLYGLALATYIAGNSISHPRTMGLHVTHLAPWPSEGTVGLVAITVSVLSAVTLAAWAPERPPGTAADATTPRS